MLHCIINMLTCYLCHGMQYNQEALIAMAPSTVRLAVVAAVNISLLCAWFRCEPGHKVDITLADGHLACLCMCKIMQDTGHHG